MCFRDVATLLPRIMMTRNVLLLAVGALVVVVGVLGYSLYEEKKQPDGVSIELGSNGLSVEQK